MDKNPKNTYEKILPFVVVVSLAVIAAILMSHIQSKKEAALLPAYTAFENKFNQVSTGATEKDVQRLLGMPASVYKEDKLIPSGLIKKWE